MTKRMDDREWLERYEQRLQNKELIDLINIPGYGVTEIGSWTFLKLSFLLGFAYMYTHIAGNTFKNLYYVDLFSGSGLVSLKNTNPSQFVLGSPILMSTLHTKFPFEKCYFLENNHHDSLENRLEILKKNKKLTCNNFEIYGKDCNLVMDQLINELKTLNRAHFLLFVDPWSTQINWRTMEKLLSLKYPGFDMIFNFQPFGVNRKSSNPKIMTQFYGDDNYKLCLNKTGKLKFNALKNYYIEKLKKFNSVNFVYNIRVSSGYGFYYDLLYTTRKEYPRWKGGIINLAKRIKKISGKDVTVVLDPNASSLDDFS